MTTEGCDASIICRPIIWETSGADNLIILVFGGVEQKAKHSLGTIADHAPDRTCAARLINEFDSICGCILQPNSLNILSMIRRFCISNGGSTNGILAASFQVN